MLADLKIDGRSRRVVMQASKNGMYYVMDAGPAGALGEELRARHLEQRHR